MALDNMRDKLEGIKSGAGEQWKFILAGVVCVAAIGFVVFMVTRGGEYRGSEGPVKTPEQLFEEHIASQRAQFEQMTPEDLKLVIDRLKKDIAHSKEVGDTGAVKDLEAQLAIAEEVRSKAGAK